MKKSKEIYRCSQCGYQAGMPLGRCPSCQEWNTFVRHEPGIEKQRQQAAAVPVPIAQVSSRGKHYQTTDIGEFDRVLGGGIVANSTIFLVGDPGIGKSTLALKVACELAHREQKVLYVSGEESAAQIKQRWLRIRGDVPAGPDIVTETNIDSIMSLLRQPGYRYVILDSIQTIHSPQVYSQTGSINQLKYAGLTILTMLKRFEQSHPLSFIVIGHVTKHGLAAGPKMLEHLVDVVLYFEGDRYTDLRFLKAVKNRFGPTDEIGIFDMSAAGIHGVQDPSCLFIQSQAGQNVGTAVTPSLQGNRVLFAEIQSLFVDAAYPNPRRITKGIRQARLNMLLALLEKRCHLSFADKEVYVNIASGLQIDDPAIDLAIAASLISNFYDKPLKKHTAYFGELALNGTVKHSRSAKRRISECLRLGFQTVFAPPNSVANGADSNGRVIAVDSIQTFIKQVLLDENTHPSV